ncbi:hypothetical protein [Mobilicoccus caccae]|uniref:hypothetical protein n=1 Tax=Mobilicoccus caccae TaxID=1859295 RepID=UPI0024E095DD|nr:hypothetical protein [Mobilicoccus caccae]
MEHSRNRCTAGQRLVKRVRRSSMSSVLFFTRVHGAWPGRGSTPSGPAGLALRHPMHH